MSLNVFLLFSVAWRVGCNSYIHSQQSHLFIIPSFAIPSVYRDTEQQLPLPSIYYSSSPFNQHMVTRFAWFWTACLATTVVVNARSNGDVKICDVQLGQADTVWGCHKFADINQRNRNTAGPCCSHSEWDGVSRMGRPTLQQHPLDWILLRCHHLPILPSPGPMSCQNRVSAG